MFQTCVMNYNINRNISIIIIIYIIIIINIIIKYKKYNINIAKVLNQRTKPVFNLHVVITLVM